jgi:uncharacterized protein (TIGR02466 family)
MMTQTADSPAGIIYAFASPIAYQVHQNVSDLNDRLAQSIRDMAKNNESDDEYRSHHGGYYSRGGFFASGADGAKELAKRLQLGFSEYIAELTAPEYGRVADLRFQTWVGLTRSGDYQRPHVHPGATLSCVYYVTVPDRPSPQGRIEFITPIDMQEMTFLRNISHGRITIDPRPGGLLIFPSCLRHYTQPFYGEGDRICVVTNV